MDKDEAIRDLMTKLMQAVEDSLSTSAAVRDALAELVRSGYEARLFFVANADTADGDGEGEAEATDEESGESADEEQEEVPFVVREIGATTDASEVRFELTKLDRDFLKSLHIRPESG
jgi:hypothetical protein